MFHCRNRGHQTKKLPASQVNDGVCDCCDGSDEHDGRVACDRKCNTLGAWRRVELAEKVTRARGGLHKKRAIVAAAPLKRKVGGLLPPITRQTLNSSSSSARLGEHSSEGMSRSDLGSSACCPS